MAVDCWRLPSVGPVVGLGLKNVVSGIAVPGLGVPLIAARILVTNCSSAVGVPWVVREAMVGGIRGNGSVEMSSKLDGVNLGLKYKLEIWMARVTRGVLLSFASWIVSRICELRRR